MLTQQRLHQLVIYDPMTGEFVRRKTGKPTGTIKYPKGVARRSLKLDSKDYLESRLAVLYMTGTMPALLVDHKNHDTLDCRWANLRVATHSQSLANRRTWGKLGFKGVTERNGRFRATLKVGGKQRHLGYFDTPRAAHDAYVRAAKVAHGAYFHP